ncbi:MAG: polyamine aminopropyltransferase [Bacteroidales bacterium]|jgi:spermidine synthase|nr:polyamine aminopropyltransferase [Bacteroidales bacterium]
MASLGRHILVEFIGCNPMVLNDVALIEQGMVKAAEKADATVINSTFHHFSPFGVSGVVVIQESHLAIHTWPEYQYAAVDLFTCGGHVDPWISFDYLKEVFGAKNYSALEMRRGNLSLLERVDFEMGRLAKQNLDYKNPDFYNRNVWFTDKDDNQAMSLRYTGEVLFDKRSELQRVRVLDTYAYGKMLVIDNMVMTTDRDEFHYHEMISHPMMLVHGNVKNVLVIGGGDGGSIREVLKHDNVEKVTMVEIDENVIDASKQFLTKLSVEFDNPKLNLIIGDGIKYVAEAPSGTFDLILVDGSDPVGPAEGLFSKTFFTNCYKALNDKGVLVVQGESPRFGEKAFVDLYHTLKDIFKRERTHVMLFNQPTYPSGIWSFHVGTKSDLDPLAVDKRRANDFAEKHDLNFYNYLVHLGAFAMPGYIKKMLS